MLYISFIARGVNLWMRKGLFTGSVTLAVLLLAMLSSTVQATADAKSQNQQSVEHSGLIPSVLSTYASGKADWVTTASTTLTVTVTPTACPLAWDVVPSPSNPTAVDSYLDAISAYSPDDIWAVGSQEYPMNSFNLITEHWNGSAWHQVPGPSYEDSTLHGIAPISTTDIWAVGKYADVDTGPPLALHWNGSAWSQVYVPYPGGQYSDAILNGIAAVNSRDIWAVGDYLEHGPQLGLLIEHWDGVQWSIALTSTDVSSLKAVSAAGSNDIWAVGETPRQGGWSNTLTMHWDGNAWTTIPSPSPDPADFDQLNGVLAISSNDVWAVGQGGSTPLIMHWDGGTWNIVHVEGDFPLVTLSGIAGNGPDNLWAVGKYGTYPGIRTLALHWEGTQWSQAYSPSVSPNTAELAGATVDSNGTFWAAGDYSDLPSKTLIERYQPGNCCQFNFTDVQLTDYFYEAVRHLYCAGAISGYSDGTFRPGNDTTRGQLTKIVVLAEGWTIDTSGGPHFSDVPASSPFYSYVETAYHRGVISGYADGTFRWGNNITRAQLSKVIVLAQQWPTNTSGGPHFSDVPPGSTFYDYVETAYHYGIVSGYADGTFRPGNNATRGQISKITYLAVIQP